MKNIKTLTKTITSLALALAVGVLPAFAVDAPADDTASGSAAASEVMKFTPVLDGVIDPEYYTSYSLSYKWSLSDRESDPENCMGSGKFRFAARDENGDIIRDKNDTIVDGNDTLYGWDCGVTSYLLWDESCLYIAVDVIDDDYACLPDESIERALTDDVVCSGSAPYLNDGLYVSFDIGEGERYVYAERGGRLISNHSSFVDFPMWHDIIENGAEVSPSEYYRVSETDHGYTLEMRLPITEEYKDAFLKNGSELSYGISVYDGSPESGLTYGVFDPYGLLPGEFSKDMAFCDVMQLSYPEKVALTLANYDVSGDGTVDTKDLTRLMKHLAGEEVELASADINGDGATDTKDLTRLMKHIAG